MVETREGSFVDGLRPRRFTDVKLHPDRLDQPLRWKKPRRIFVNSMSDLFHEDIHRDFILQVFVTMVMAPQHTFQILTKRANRMQELLTHWLQPALDISLIDHTWPLPNVWLGISAEDQQRADERIPLLLNTPAAVRFVSLEPLLGAIDLLAVPAGSVPGYAGLRLRDKLHWVIVGGESGGSPERALVGRTTSNHVWNRGKVEYIVKAEALKWVREIRDQCLAAKVPFFLKQWGGPTPKSGGRMLDGRTWDEMPK